MKEKLENLIREALQPLQIEVGDIALEHPVDLSNGDYSTSVALAYAKGAKMRPKELAEKILKYLETADTECLQEIDRIEIAGPGFINFYLTKEFFNKSIGEIVEGGEKYGRGNSLEGEKVMVEHTDPNPFKEFHIGHLMPNVIGSTIARLFEWNGAEVKQACYQGDVGMHVAKAIWAKLKGEKENEYVIGNSAFEEDEGAKQEIKEINKKIYDRSDTEINKLYDEGRQTSLDYFDSIYKKINARFDFFFFESITAPIGKQIVEVNKEIFTESDGAIVFKAEEHDPSLHTRVFINSEGLPTYEAKELGLAQIKFEAYPYTKSIVVTGNEIKEYFRVLLAAMKLVFPDLSSRTKHLPHGMLRLPSGKMSSRDGSAQSALSLIEQVKEAISSKGDIAQDEVAIGAIKYMILRQAIGNDIVFDFEKSVSTEGDSGVYLQYAYARTCSILEKAGQLNNENNSNSERPTHEVEKLLYRFPEIVERAMQEYSPNYLTTYLTEIAGSFNNLYANEQIISLKSDSAYLLSVTKAFNTVMKNGLTILGIPTPEKM